MARAYWHWLSFSILVVAGAATAAACGGEDTTNGSTTSSSSSGTTTATSSGGGIGGHGGSSSASSSSSGQTGGATSNGGAGGAGGDGGEMGGAAPEVKVAFLADTGYLLGFNANLDLIKAEGADFVVHPGDFDYSQLPFLFFGAVDLKVGHQYPYFLAVGNHDISAWDGYSKHMMNHLTPLGVVLDDPDLSDENYATEFMGIQLVVVGQSASKLSTFEPFLLDKLDEKDKRWKVCAWHKNQSAMQVGSKGDEMGWGPYEACRQKGALIATGHEHSYSRTKTLIDMTNQTVDPSCSDPKKVCVGPGRTFAFVSGLGGKSIRKQSRCLPTTPPYGCKGEWASMYAEQQNANYGTLFITFNAGGNPNKAHAYFKDIGGQVIDEFDITKD